MKQLAANGLACYRVAMLGNLAAYSTKDLSDSYLKVVSLVDSEDGDGKFTEEAMEAIGHTTLENALGYEKGEIPTGNQV